MSGLCQPARHVSTCKFILGLILSLSVGEGNWVAGTVSGRFTVYLNQYALLLSVTLHCLSSVLKSVSGMVAADRLVSFGTYKLRWLQYRRAVFD